MAQRIDWGSMTEEETRENVKDGFALLDEDNQMELIVAWVDELGGPENFQWSQKGE